MTREQMAELVRRKGLRIALKTHVAHVIARVDGEEYYEGLNVEEGFAPPDIERCLDRHAETYWRSWYRHASAIVRSLERIDELREKRARETATAGVEP